MIRVTWNSQEIDGVLRNPSCDFPMSSLRHYSLYFYSSIQNSPFSNESFIIFENDLPVCCGVKVNSSGQLSFFDWPFRIEFSAQYLSGGIKKDLEKCVVEAIWRGTGSIIGANVEIPLAHETTNGVLEQLLPLAEGHSLYVEGFLDLSADAPNLEENLRNAHRQGIRNTESKLDSVCTYFGEIHHATFDAYKKLHFVAAGRQTRSPASWEEQKKAIIDCRASLTTVVHETEVIGATFSWLSPSAGLYGSGAYDRSKFSRFSISHVSLFRSIQHARNIGIKHYIVGEVFKPDGSRKEKNIAHFKRGFSKTKQYFHRLRLSRN